MPEAEADARAGGDVDERLMRVGRMFGPHRDDPDMRELCRLAIKCVQEGWIDA